MKTAATDLVKQADGNYAVRLGTIFIGIVGCDEGGRWFATCSTSSRSSRQSLSASYFYVNNRSSRAKAVRSLVEWHRTIGGLSS
jgi:hypothetical protein